jgi:hypothetical protein
MIGVAAVVAAVAIPLALRSGGKSDLVAGPGGPSPTGPSAANPTTNQWLVSDGARVTGRGTLFSDNGGSMRLCAEVVMTMDLPTSQAGCNGVSVVVTGIGANRLTDTTTHGQAFSPQVDVVGRYSGGALVAESVTEVGQRPADPQPEPKIPCPAPPGGWKAGYGAGGDDADAQNGLIAHVRGNPDRYLDIWEGHPDGVGTAANSYQPSTMVFVVGTTGDLDAGRDELGAIYHGNLCVYPATHSDTDLQRIADRLRSVSATTVAAEVDPIAGRVAVTVAVLDAAAQAMLATFDSDALIVKPPLLVPVR